MDPHRLEGVADVALKGEQILRTQVLVAWLLAVRDPPRRNLHLGRLCIETYHLPFWPSFALACSPTDGAIGGQRFLRDILYP